jgi:hypothetical protein
MVTFAAEGRTALTSCNRSLDAPEMHRGVSTNPAAPVPEISFPPPNERMKTNQLSP